MATMVNETTGPNAVLEKIIVGDSETPAAALLRWRGPGFGDEEESRAREELAASVGEARERFLATSEDWRRVLDLRAALADVQAKRSAAQNAADAAERRFRTVRGEAESGAAWAEMKTAAGEADRHTARLPELRAVLSKAEKEVAWQLQQVVRQRRKELVADAGQRYEAAALALGKAIAEHLPDAHLFGQLARLDDASVEWYATLP